jgi:hypothetical protein
MKRIIFSTILLISTAGFASAQSADNRNTNTTSVSKTSSKSNKASSKKKISKQKRITDPEILDNRKEYMKDGQKATITGHEAAPTNGEQYQSIKDSASTKRKKQ